MSKVKGVVTGCGKGKFSFFITLDSKEGFYFNTKYEPKCGKGDVVGIEYEQKADNRGNVKRVEVLEKNSNGYEDTSGGGSSSNSGSGGGGGGGARQDSIVWQHSQEMALTLAGLLIQNEAFALKGKADAKRVQLEALVDELTARLFGDAMNPKESAAFTTNAEIEEDATPAKEEEEKWDDGEDASKSGSEWED